MKPDFLKKILIISSYAPPAIGGPQNLYNLLRDFPVENYSVLTSYYNIDNLSALRGLWLGGEYIFYDNPKANKKTRIEAATDGSMTSWLSHKIQQLRFIMKRFAPIRVLGGSPVILLQVFSIVKIGRKITKTGIGKLIGFSDYGPAMLGTYFLHKFTGLPYYIFLFDLYKGNFLPFPGELLANFFEQRILKNAEKIIVTNSGTKKIYEKRYGLEVGKKIIIIHNSVFPESYDKKNHDKKEREDNLPFTILFTGRIYWPQIGALKNLIKAVSEMKDMSIVLKIYSPSPKDYLEKLGITESTRVKIDMASPKKIPEIQQEADILFLPLSWNTQSQQIIDTATPGKLTDYLIAGKPILIHAPASSYLVEYAKEKNFALTIEQNNVEQLKDGIIKLLREPLYVKQLVQNAQRTFFENHDANKNAQIFRKMITPE